MKLISPSLLISVPRTCSIPTWLRFQPSRCPFYFYRFVVWGDTARIVKMWVIPAVPFILLYSRYFLTVTNILLTSAEHWTDFFREIPSDSKITPERLQPIWIHFYVFTFKIDFPHVQQFMFIWSGRVVTIHLVKTYSGSCSTCISNREFFRFIPRKLLTSSLVNSDKRIY